MTTGLRTTIRLLVDDLRIVRTQRFGCQFALVTQRFQNLLMIGGQAHSYFVSSYGLTIGRRDDTGQALVTGSIGPILAPTGLVKDSGTHGATFTGVGGQSPRTAPLRRGTLVNVAVPADYSLHCRNKETAAPEQ